MWEDKDVSWVGDEIDIYLDKAYFWPFLVQLLEEAGATSPSGQIAEYGPPGMSSAMSQLYARDPDAVVSKAFAKLSGRLKDRA